jgi:putative ABC transport system permease protein
MRRWWGGLRAAARIARRDARRAKGRSALVAVLVGLPVLAGSGFVVVLASQSPTDATYARWVLGEGDGQALVSAYRGPNLTQDPRGARSGWSSNIVADTPGIVEYERLLADALPPEDHLLRTLRGMARLATPDRAVPGTTELLELPADGDLSSIVATQEGALPTAPGQVALDGATAERLGVEVGDVVTMEPSEGAARELTVSGILAPSAEGPSIVVGPGVLVPPETAGSGVWMGGAVRTSAEWYVLGPEPVTWDHVLAVNEIGSAVTSRAVLLDPPPREAVPYLTNGGLDEPVVRNLAVGGAVAATALLEAALLIGPAFAVGARRQQRQLALLAASGAERRTLRGVVLLGGVVTGAAAAVGGAVAGVATVVGIRAVVHLRGGEHVFFLPDIRVPWLVLLAFAVVGTAAATMAAWLPARRAARVDVIAALAGRRAEAAPHRRVPLIGAGVFVAGSVAAVAGAATGQTMLLVSGVLALEIGMVAASGGLLALVARLAPRLGPVGRIAVRDAARNRSRTAPAVAAVIAAVAGITAGAIYSGSDRASQAAMWSPPAAVGTVLVQLPTEGTDDEVAEQVDAATAAVRGSLPVTDVLTVHVAVPADDDGAASPDDGAIAPLAVPNSYFSVTAEVPPEQQCPLWADDAEMTDAELRAAARDERCREIGSSGQLIWFSNRWGSTTLVDDGTVVGALGLPTSPAAAQALARGMVVVGSEQQIWPGGTAQIVLSRYDPSGEGPDRSRTVDLPAVAAGLGGQLDVVLPPGALAELGLTTEVAGLVGPVSRTPTTAEEAAATAALATTAWLGIERGNPYEQTDLTMLALVVAALVVGLAATGISVVLAAVESRPDLATLGAVGAEPRVRRRFTAAQAGVVSVLGGSLGILAGVMLGWVLVTAQRYRNPVPDYTWTFVAPWPSLTAIAIGIPLLATAAGYLSTRSRLPLVRRFAG